MRVAANEAFTLFLPVNIDVKPGDPNNTINLKSKADVTVAILGSAVLGAANIDPASVTFAGTSVATRGNGSLRFSLSDVNRDGFIDLLVDFRARDLQLAATDTQAVLKGTTFAGQRIRGVDTDKRGRSDSWPMARVACLQGRAIASRTVPKWQPECR